MRIALSDVAAPSVSIGGSLLGGGELRGPQTLDVAAADVGSGLQAVGVAVNGKAAVSEDLSAACNPLPGNLTSRMAPCPPSFSHTYTLDTAQPPFHDGINSVAVCVHDYAQTGTANQACRSAEVLTDNLCPARRSAAGRASPPASPATTAPSERWLSASGRWFAVVCSAAAATRWPVRRSACRATPTCPGGPFT